MNIIWQGAGWKLFSMACFAAMNGIVRYLSHGGEDYINVLPTNVIIFIQNVVGTCCMLPWVLKSGLTSLKTEHPWLHFFRVATAVAGVYLWYLTLKVMPIAEGVALSFTGPIFTVIGASLLLHEKLSIQRTLAILFSLMGAFIISRPDIALMGAHHPIGLYALFPLSSAIVLSISKLLTRKLGILGETPASLATYLLLFMAPLSFPQAAYDWVTPNTYHYPWLLLLGILAAAAHLSFGKAYKMAEVTFLTPFGFFKFFFSVLVGYIAFAEFPESWSIWVGILVILISTLLLSYNMPLYSWARRLRSN